KPAQRKKLEENRDKAYMSRDLAKIKCDLQVDVDFEKYKRVEPDRTKLHDVFSRLEFASLMQEYLPEAPPIPRDYRTATSAGEIRSFVSGEGPIAIWFEPMTADGFDELMAASLSVKVGESLIVPIAKSMGGSEEMQRELRKLLESDRLLVTHDAKLQMRRLAANGWPVPKRFADTMIMSYVINPGLPSHELGNIARDR